MKHCMFFLLAFVLLSCSEDDEIQRMEIKSFSVIPNNIGEQSYVRVKANTLYAYEHVRLYALLSGNGINKEIPLAREEENVFSNYTIVYVESEVPPGTYTVRLFSDVGNGPVATTFEKSITIEYESIDSPTSLSLDVSSTVEHTSADVRIDYAYALPGSFLRVRVLHNSSTTVFVADYELSEQGSIDVDLQNLVPGQSYLVRMTGVPTANDYPDLLEEYLFETTTTLPGTLNANLSQAYGITTQSAHVTVTYVNTTGSAVSATLMVIGSQSGVHNSSVILSETTFGEQELSIGGLDPNEVVEVRIIVEGTILDTMTFSTEAIEYSQVSLSSPSSFQITPGMNNLPFVEADFYSNGSTTLQEVRFKFKSMNDAVEVWEIFLLLGVPGNNMFLGNQSSWQSLGNGWYEASLMVSSSVYQGNNTFSTYISTGNYSISETVTFQGSLTLVDQQGQEIGGSIHTWTILP